MDRRTQHDSSVPLSVLSVSPSVNGGGAERVALMLHERYLAQGVDSWLAVANVNADAARILQVPVDDGRGPWASSVLRASRAAELLYTLPGHRGPAWFGARALRMLAEPRRVRRVMLGHEDFEFPWTNGLLEMPPTRPDVLHLHNLHGAYFDVRALPSLSARVPTILTLHDAWLLTGHCAYPSECARWRDGCGGCPDLGRYVPVWGDETAANRAMKRQALLTSRLGLASPSRWLLDMVENSGILGEGIEGRVIPNGVDTAIFRPGKRTEAREALGLPQDRRVIVLAGRDLCENVNKGFDTFAEAMDRLPEDIARNVLVITLGDDGASVRLGAAEMRPVRFTDDTNRVAEYYRAADLFVHPARAEVFGLVVAEAMACGTPVLASDAGGIPEVIEDGLSGVLFRAGAADELAVRMEGLLSDDETRARIAQAGTVRIRSRFTLDMQVQTYLSWYDERVSDMQSAGRDSRRR